VVSIYGGEIRWCLFKIVRCNGACSRSRGGGDVRRPRRGGVVSVPDSSL